MRITINFDHEVRRVREEVGDVRINPVLASEAHAELIATESTPKGELGCREFFAHFSRARNEGLAEHFAGAGSLRWHGRLPLSPALSPEYVGEGVGLFLVEYFVQIQDGQTHASQRGVIGDIELFIARALTVGEKLRG